VSVFQTAFAGTNTSFLTSADVLEEKNQACNQGRAAAHHSPVEQNRQQQEL
jgi:hypothetical protein